jgi:hypothetical protein
LNGGARCRHDSSGDVPRAEYETNRYCILSSSRKKPRRGYGPGLRIWCAIVGRVGSLILRSIPRSKVAPCCALFPAVDATRLRRWLSGAQSCNGGGGADDVQSTRGRQNSEGGRHLGRPTVSQTLTMIISIPFAAPAAGPSTAAGAFPSRMLCFAALFCGARRKV